jgi:peptidylprolyl isomerase
MYHKPIMKLIPALLLLVAAGPALAQTTAAKPAVRHTTTTHTAGACADIPTLAPTIPKAVGATPGCPKVLYALRYTDTKIGTGAAVTPRKWLTVNYTGYLVDGTKFDSSIGTDKDGKPKEPITFPYGAHQVITGWDTGFEGMMIGGKRRLFIPSQLAYGEMGRPPVIPAKATLIFDVELLGISDTPPKPPAGATPPPQRPQTPPPAGTQPTRPTPPTGTQPAQPAPPPGSPTTATPPPANPANPATVPPPTDPTKPAAVPPPSTTSKP